MATITKRGSTWRAQIMRGGVRTSGTFRTKLEAQAWAADIEMRIQSGKYRDVPNIPVSELLDRYGREYSSKKGGHRPELLRLAAMSRDPLGSVLLPDLSPQHLDDWTKRRLAVVTGSSVQRDRSILSHAFTIARTVWHWLDSDPFEGLERPEQNPPRTRIATDAEVERMLIAFGYDEETAPVSVAQRVAGAWLFATETAMREGEICRLRTDDIDITTGVAFLRKTKNGHPREVPLSDRALVIVEHFNKCGTPGAGIFGLKESQVSPAFKAATTRALVEDLVFHDSRHAACTRLARKMNVLALARMTGHRDLKKLLIYYNETAAEMRKMINA